MQAKLVIIAGSTKPQEIRLKLPAILGRGRACSIQLPQPLVSRQHCEIFADGEQLRIRDLGSLNGTLVNNERITECELTDGQLLTVGSITFRVAIDVTATTGKPSGSSINKGPAPATTTPALDSAAEETTNFVSPNEFTERAIEPIRSEPETRFARSDIPSTANPPHSPASDTPASDTPASKAPSPVTPPSASESSVRADDLLPPSIAADFMPPAAIPPVAIPSAIAPPAAIAPIAGPFPSPPMPIPAVPPMAMPVAMPMAAPLASPLPPGAAPPATPPNVFSAPPPTSPPDQAPPAADADDADLQAFLKSLGKKK